MVTIRFHTLTGSARFGMALPVQGKPFVCRIFRGVSRDSRAFFNKKYRKKRDKEEADFSIHPVKPVQLSKTPCHYANCASRGGGVLPVLHE